MVMCQEKFARRYKLTHDHTGKGVNFASLSSEQPGRDSDDCAIIGPLVCSESEASMLSKASHILLQAQLIIQYRERTWRHS